MNREIYEEQYQPEEPLKSDTPEHDPQGPRVSHRPHGGPAERTGSRARRP